MLRVTAPIARLAAGSSVAGVLLISAAAAPAVAAPQTASSAAETEALQDVVITATRIAREIGKVPISVTAFDQEQLDQRNVRDFSDVARLTPGVTFTRATRGNTSASNLSIRGISSGAGAATVGVYIDDTPVQVRPQSLSSANPYPRIFDLERIEILRGPQGTLFGAGSQGGTVRFITPEPSTERTSVYGRAELASTRGGDLSYELGAAAGGPLVDGKVGGRISAWYRKDGGYVDRVSWVDGKPGEKNSDSADALTVRGALKFAIGDRLTVTPSVFYQKSNIDDSSIYWEFFSNPDSNKYNNGNPIKTPTEDEFMLGSVRVEYEWDSVALVSNTSYFERDNVNLYDNTTLGLANFIGWPNVQPPPALSQDYAFGELLDRQKVTTQELRLQSTNPDARASWLVGVFFQRAKQYSENFIQRPFILDEIKFRTGGVPLTVQQFFGVPLYQGIYQLYATSDTVDREMSAFANIDYKLTNRLTLTAGIRAGRNEYDNKAFSAGPTVRSVGTTSVSSQEDTPVSPKVGLSFQATDNSLYYLSYGEGYRQGSTAGQVSSNCDADLAALGLTSAPREIKPDTVKSFELGVKGKGLDGRLAFDASVYRINWTDIQSGLILPNCNIPIIANFGDARSQGFEIQANALFGNLTLGFAGGYTDAEYTTQTSGAGGRVIRSKGEPLPTPPWTVALSAQYGMTFFSRPGYMRADYQYLGHDDSPLDLASAATDPTLPRAPASRNLDLRVGMKIDAFDVSIFVANATDQNPQFGRYRDTTRSFNYRGVTVRPRTVGITTTYKF